MATNQNNTAAKILELASKFVADQDGVWEHQDWEKLLKQVEKLGLSVDDGVKRNLGNILEASKFFHFIPVGSEKKTAPAKKKVSAKG